MNIKTQSTHTQWHVERPFNEPGLYVSDSDTNLICKVYEIDGHIGEQRAHLIAAAPELLACLERVNTFLIRNNVLNMSFPGDIMLQDAMATVIEKAKGGA